MLIFQDTTAIERKFSSYQPIMDTLLATSGLVKSCVKKYIPRMAKTRPVHHHTVDGSRNPKWPTTILMSKTLVNQRINCQPQLVSDSRISGCHQQ